jgi:hypothetical protein
MYKENDFDGSNNNNNNNNKKNTAHTSVKIAINIITLNKL